MVVLCSSSPKVALVFDSLLSLMLTIIEGSAVDQDTQAPSIWKHSQRRSLSVAHHFLWEVLSHPTPMEALGFLSHLTVAST